MVVDIALPLLWARPPRGAVAAAPRDYARTDDYFLGRGKQFLGVALALSSQTGRVKISR
jgi:hypothetical protein